VEALFFFDHCPEPGRIVEELINIRLKTAFPWKNLLSSHSIIFMYIERIARPRYFAMAAHDVW